MNSNFGPFEVNLRTIRSLGSDCPILMDGPSVGPRKSKNVSVISSYLRTVRQGTDRPRLDHGSPAATPTSVLGGVCFYGFLGVYRGHSK